MGVRAEGSARVEQCHLHHLARGVALDDSAQVTPRHIELQHPLTLIGHALTSCSTSLGCRSAMSRR